MRLVKLLSVIVAVAGLALVVAAVAPSVSGHPVDSAAAGSSNGGLAQGERAQTDRPEPRRRQRELTVLAGRGAEIGASIRDVEGSDKARTGVVVEDVRPDSPAEKAGLKRSDVIVEFDGEAVRSARQFTRLVRETAPGRSVKATIVRDGARKDVQVTPSEGRDSIVIDGDRLRERLGDLYERMPQFNFDFDLPFPFESRGRLGVSVQELTPQLAGYFGAKDGVLVTAVTEDGPAAHAGLKAGDVITKANDAPVRSREDLVRALRDVKDDGQATIGIVRDKRETTVTVKLEPRRPARTGRPA